MGQGKRRSWINYLKPGPLCPQCGANSRFVYSKANVIRLLLNVPLGLLLLTGVIPVRYRCPKCGLEHDTSA